jgi:hypothetical protein
MKEIVKMCKNCKRLPQLDKEKSNNSWEVTTQKNCPICGREYSFEVVSKRDLAKMEQEREGFGKYV